MTPNRANGAVFPLENVELWGVSGCESGITIAQYARIQFIAAVLNGSLASPNLNLDTIETDADIASAAIKIADAALKAGGYTNEN